MVATPYDLVRSMYPQIPVSEMTVPMLSASIALEMDYAPPVLNALAFTSLLYKGENLDTPYRITLSLIRYGCVEPETVVSALLWDAVGLHSQRFASMQGYSLTENEAATALDAYLGAVYGDNVRRYVYMLTVPSETFSSQMTVDQVHEAYYNHKDYYLSLSPRAFLVEVVALGVSADALAAQTTTRNHLASSRNARKLLKVIPLYRNNISHIAGLVPFENVEVIARTLDRATSVLERVVDDANKNPNGGVYVNNKRN